MLWCTFLKTAPTGPPRDNFLGKGQSHSLLHSCLGSLTSNCPSFCWRGGGGGSHCPSRHPLGRYSKWHWARYIQLPRFGPQETPMHPCSAVVRNIVSSRSALSLFLALSCSHFHFHSSSLTFSATGKLNFSQCLIPVLMHSNPQHVHLSKLISWHPISLSLEQGWRSSPEGRRPQSIWKTSHIEFLTLHLHFPVLFMKQVFMKPDAVHTFACFAYIVQTLLWNVKLRGYCCSLWVSGASAETVKESFSFDHPVRYWFTRGLLFFLAWPPL